MMSIGLLTIVLLDQDEFLGDYHPYSNIQCSLHCF